MNKKANRNARYWFLFIICGLQWSNNWIVIKSFSKIFHTKTMLSYINLKNYKNLACTDFVNVIIL